MEKNRLKEEKGKVALLMFLPPTYVTSTLVRICWFVDGWYCCCKSDCCVVGLAAARQTAVKWQLP